MGQEATAEAIDPGVEELTQDFFPSAQPESASPEQAQVSGEPPAQDAQTQPTTESAQAPTPAPVERFNYLGREYTREQLLADPQLLNAIVTTANQGPHFKSLYEQRLAQERQVQVQAQAQAMQQQAQAAAQQAQPGGYPIPDQIRAQYAVPLKRAVELGHIEPEIAEAYPNFAANMMRAFDGLQDARQAVELIAERINAMDAGATQSNVLREIDSTVAGLASQGEYFAGLADPQERGGFFNYLVSINPQVGLLRDPNFVASQYVAYKKDEVLASVAEARKAQAERHAADQRKRQLARGVGGGTRPSGLQPDNGQGFMDADLMSDFQHIFKR